VVVAFKTLEKVEILSYYLCILHNLSFNDSLIFHDKNVPAFTLLL